MRGEGHNRRLYLYIAFQAATSKLVGMSSGVDMGLMITRVIRGKLSFRHPLSDRPRRISLVADTTRGRSFFLY